MILNTYTFDSNMHRIQFISFISLLVITLLVLFNPSPHAPSFILPSTPPTTSPRLAYLSPLLRAMLMSFSMPPASLRAFVFSMFLVMTSCSAQQMAVMVSSDMVIPTRALPLEPPPPPPPLLVLLLLLPPGKRCTRSLMAYLPVLVAKAGCKSVGRVEKQNEAKQKAEPARQQRLFGR